MPCSTKTTIEATMDPPAIYLVHISHYDSELSGFYKLKTKNLAQFALKVLERAVENNEPLEATMRPIPRDEWNDKSKHVKQRYREWLGVLEDIMASLNECLPTSVPKCKGVSINMVRSLPVEDNLAFALAQEDVEDTSSSDEEGEIDDEEDSDDIEYDDDSSSSDDEGNCSSSDDGEDEKPPKKKQKA